MCLLDKIDEQGSFSHDSGFSCGGPLEEVKCGRELELKVPDPLSMSSSTYSFRKMTCILLDLRALSVYSLCSKPQYQHSLKDGVPRVLEL